MNTKTIQVEKISKAQIGYIKTLVEMGEGKYNTERVEKLDKRQASLLINLLEKQVLIDTMRVAT